MITLTGNLSYRATPFNKCRMTLPHILVFNRNKPTKMGWAAGVTFSAGRGIFFSLHHRLQTGSGAHSASYSVGTDGFTQR